MASSPYVKQTVTGRFSAQTAELLDATCRSLELGRSTCLSRAVDYWCADSRTEPCRLPDTGDGVGVCVALSHPVLALLKATAEDYKVKPIRLVEAAFVQWFEDVGGLLIYKAGKIPGTAAEVELRGETKTSLETITVIRQQFEYYKRCGNVAKAAAFARRLKEAQAALQGAY